MKEDTYNFGLKKLEAFMDSIPEHSTLLDKILPPNKEEIVYIVVLTDGLARAQLFVPDKEQKISFLPKEALHINVNYLQAVQLLFGIGINPPMNYCVLPCGEITYRK